VEGIVSKQRKSVIFSDHFFLILQPHRIAKRDGAKRRYEQKNTERAMVARERASAIKEKEKVRAASTADSRIFMLL
jgi:hypothetical protein